MGWSRTAEGLASGGRQVSWWALRFRMPELDLRRNQRRVATGNPPMSRLHTALLLLTDDCTGSDLAVILDIPKRTADRWLAELRAGELGNWHAGAIEALAAHEAHAWGTTRLADALRPEGHATQTRDQADADRVARVMVPLVASHQINAELLGTMATDLADGELQDHEARALLPMVEKAQAAAMAKHRALVNLQQMLENRLRGR